MGQSADRLKHSAWLDWVRGTAALVVFAAHLRTFSFVVYGSLPAEDQTLLNAVWFAVTRFGHDAVVIFFVLSGFLVGGTALDLARAGRFDVSRYATARIARIGIVCVPAVMLGWAVSTYSGETLPLATVLGNMVGLQTVAVPVIEVNGPLWSLSYEIWFYVLCGAALSVTSRSLRSHPRRARIAIRPYLRAQCYVSHLLAGWGGSISMATAAIPALFPSRRDVPDDRRARATSRCAIDLHHCNAHGACFAGSAGQHDRCGESVDVRRRRSTADAIFAQSRDAPWIGACRVWPRGILLFAISVALSRALVHGHVSASSIRCVVALYGRDGVPWCRVLERRAAFLLALRATYIATSRNAVACPLDLDAGTHCAVRLCQRSKCGVSIG